MITGHGHPMRFPHCTPQQLTLDGTWQHTDQHLRFTGIISSTAPFVILSLLKCGAAYHYMKHPKSDALTVPLVLYQMQFPQKHRYQHSLVIAQAVNLGATSEGRVFLAGDLPMTFPAGHLVPFATDTQQQPFIFLLALAKADITSKRNGIWAVKPRVLERVEASWRDILSKTRHGFIRVE
jgi:hypothetical protein